MGVKHFLLVYPILKNLKLRKILSKIEDVSLIYFMILYIPKNREFLPLIDFFWSAEATDAASAAASVASMVV